jgi:anti-sigma factor RsiW
MAQTCSYPINRDETLVAYLYDDIEAAERTAFEAHITSCEVCREELASLQGVRQRLARWSPPEPHFVVTSHQSPGVIRQSPVLSRPAPLDERRTTNDERRTSWRQLPAWAQVAAALLFLGVSAGVANLDVRYDQNGLSVRTGWSKPAAPVRPAADSARQDAVSQADLIALEQRLRSEVRALQTSAHAGASADSQTARASSDAEVLRRVRLLVDESEKRQQRELALRVGEVLRDVNAQRQADLVRFDHSLGLVQNNLGVEVLKQRERVNYLMRVNQRQ